MKLFSSLLLVSCATAFSPPSTFGVSRTVSGLNMIPDPELLQHLANHGGEAVGAVIQQCDNQECVMVQAWKTGNGWHFGEGLGDKMGTSQRIAMVSMNDTE